MAEFDIRNPEVSAVTKGIEGKIILIHSFENKVGKTKVGTQMPKPLYLRFEQGINAISGLPYMALNSWGDFKKVNKQLCNPRELEENRKLYTTIIIDTLDVAIRWCDAYVCAMQGVTRINDGNDGFGLWTEYANEWFREFNKLTNAGYCLYFISHSDSKELTDPITKEKYDKMVPVGDKRTIKFIEDAADVIGYVKSNGFDEDGKEIPSSLYLGNDKGFKAGSRFDYLTPFIKEFTAENLIEAIGKAVEMEEKASGIKGKTFDEKKKAEVKIEKRSFADLKTDIQKYAIALCKDPINKQVYVDTVEQHLGVGNKVSDANEKQYEQIEIILFELEELADEKGIEV